MAVMATQNTEGALLSEKPLQNTVSVEKEGPNGHLEVNGHSSPQQESKMESSPKDNAKSPPTVGSKLDQNQDAFSANQSLPAEAKDEKQPAKDEKVELEADGGSGQETAKEADNAKLEGATTPADTDMPDAPANPAADERKMSEPTSPKSQPKSLPENRSDAQTEPPADAAAATTSASEQPAPGTAQPDAKGDTIMTDAQEEKFAASAPADAAESTQDTTLSDVSPVTPVGDSITAGTDSRVDAPKSTPPPPTTADTSMSETAQASAKLSRERDIDSEDEPVAKRTKVQHAENQVEVKTTPAQDRMDVDKKDQGGAGSLYRANGEPKSLTDESLNDLPITEWQAKQIRSVLAGVKKTKVGMGFRQPVRDLWPGLWNEYSARVSNPVDISSMEKRLRGDKPPYATMGEFKRDLDLMVQNSVAFNGEVHDVTHQARSCRESILSRMAGLRAAEPTKPEKKESSKAHTTRHAEPRSAPTIGVARPVKPTAPSPAQKPVVESPAFAIPANNNGMPLIRRDSTKPDSRAKRPVKPAHSKDLVYDTKRKKKLPLELRFCDEVLTEIRKTKNYEINAAFMQPVDPVALNIPSYHRIIKKPMDLGTMSNKLGSGEYTSAKEFEKDFDLIIKNCRTFNGEDHVIYHQALRLQDLYRAEMSRKDEWMAKHAPAATSHTAASSHLRDDSDDEDADSEADPEHEEERKQSLHRSATIQKRLEEEQKKVNQMVNSGTAEFAEVEIAQSLVAMLQKQLMQERAKMASLTAKKAGKPKPAKTKKSGGGGGMLGKKASVAGPSGGMASAKKGGGIKKAPPKKKIGQAEKELISTHLGLLEGPLLERAIDLIKKDTGQGENDSGELELDIDSLSEDALSRLLDLVIKGFPHLREKDKGYAAAAAPSSDPPASKSNRQSSMSKSKKNKPMSKSEQERRIQQLNELRAQAGRQASGSQEPIESIEGNGNEPTGQPDHESEDEVSSEEE